MDKPKLIAEIGCNHKGDFEIAKEMIEVAADCGADVVKFQKRDNKKVLTEEEYNSPHPVPHNSYGETYGKHREFLEFDIEKHRKLKEHAEQNGVIYSSSVWDINSAQEMVELNPEFIKIPSALATHYEVLDYLRDNYGGVLHISTGMTKQEERFKLMQYLIYNEIEAVVYHCTSGYPITFEQARLLGIRELQSIRNQVANNGHDYGITTGYSGHHKGIAIDIAAYTLGAEYIERHFTLDRTWKGTDHAASLEPQGFERLKRNLVATYEALQHRPEGFLDIEKPQVKKLRWDR